MILKYAKKFCLLPLTVAVLGIVGCVHTPDKGTLQSMSPFQAQQTLKSKYLVERSEDGKSGTRKLVNKKRIIFFSSAGEVHQIKFSKISKISTFNSLVEVTQEGRNQLELVCIPSEVCADAIYVLKEAAPEEMQKDESNFERAAQTYRNAATKPEFTEEVRRYKVLAEAAVREKRFADAVGYYESALDIAPWWPDGHFNSALVLGEIGDYETAAFEMKRYLRLEPNAPNVRSVQDKIYEWESKVK